MAKESNIIYNGKGFWIPEGFIEVLSQYICETFENIGLNTFSANLKKIYGSCDGNRSGGYSGMVSIPLDRYIISQTDKSDFIHVLDQVKLLLQSKGAELGITVLNQFENSKIDPYFINEWFFSIKTQSLISTVDIIEQMLNGTWSSTNKSIYYTGFPNPGNMPEI